MTHTICGFLRATAAIAAGVIVFATGAHSQGANLNPGVYPPESKPYGLSYGEWSARWWQWILPIPPKTSPILDTTGALCGQGQSGLVWFLPGTFGGAATRFCTVPPETSLVFPILNTSFGAGLGDCLTPGVSPGPCPDVSILRAGAAAQMDNPQALEVTVDGLQLLGPSHYRAQSPVFDYWLTSDNLYNFAFGFHNNAGNYQPAVSDGYWVMLTPLAQGSHTLHFKGVLNGGAFTTEVTYHIIVSGH